MKSSRTAAPRRTARAPRGARLPLHRRALHRLAPLLLGLALVPLARAQDGASEDVRALFPRVARIDTAGAYGLVRAPLPAEVLESVRADLADVRVFVYDQSVEFVIESDPPRQPGEARLLTPLDVRERMTGERQAPRVEETWDVELPSDWPDARTQPEQAAVWRLEFRFGPSELVRELTVHRVEASGAETEVLSTTLFRMLGPLREKVAVDVPAVPGARLRLRLTGPAPAERPAMTLRRDSRSAGPRELSVPLEVVSSERSADGQETILTVRRPRGIVPDALVFETSSGAFHREVIVEDAGVGARSAEVGRGVIFAIPSWDEASLELSLGRTSGDLLRVRVVDQDAPPLAELRVGARVRQPALVFEAQGREAQLYYGGARATRPAYGLGELRGRLTPSAAVADARVEESRANPSFHAGPVLEFAMRAGAPVELAGFSHVLPLRAGETTEGLIRVRLPFAALALARDDLGDVRIVDADRRQWPYLWGDDWTEESIQAAVRVGPLPEGRGSSVSVELPPGGVQVEHVQLDVTEALVSRPYEVWGAYDAEGELTELSSGTLTRGPGIRGPLRVDVGRSLYRLELRVRDGDERALSVRGATVVTRARDLLFAAPPGEYRLLLGNAQLGPPAYDVESARDLVLSLRAADATLGELAANPEFAPPSPSRDALTETALLVVLALAVLLLGGLTFRLVRSEAGSESESASASASESASASASASASESESESESESGAGGAPHEGRDKLPE
ncbi:MAG: hypothetical protein KC593_13870 [Myxococcales bacterium]|nr:hypothetical protein [Myxococcales bacterium]